MSSSVALGAVVAAVVGAAAAPYLAGLTRTAPDRDDKRWWRATRTDPRRLVVTALVAAVLGALGGSAAGWTVLLPPFVTLALTGAPLVVIDFDQHRLPNRLVYPMAVAGASLFGLAAAVRSDGDDLLRAAGGAAAVFVVLYAMNFFLPRSFGRGDVRLGGILGGYLGWFGWAYVYYGIFAGFLLGAVIAVVLLATGRADRKTPVPFGPMLIIGPLVVLAFDLVPSTIA